jgi:perosamine synthetase
MNPAIRPVETAILQALQSVLGNDGTQISLHEPEFTSLERERVLDCIDSGFVSSVGRYVDRFEAMLSEATGARHAVAVVNGTAALQVALKLAGVGGGDEVLVPALSFVATANAVVHCGAVPHFVDSNGSTLGMDPVALEEYLVRVAEPSQGGVRNRFTGRRIAAVVPMHAFGHPVDIVPLVELADRLRLPVVEDAAESLGSTYRGRHTGTFGKFGVLSFNGNKIITTGGGGAILTDDPGLAQRAKHLTTTAKLPHRWEFVHDEVAWNYRLPNLNAALGCAQLERLADFVLRKRALAMSYQAAFDIVDGVEFVAEPPECRSNYWLNTLRLCKPDMAARDRVLNAVNDSGYQCRPAWTLLNRLEMFSACPRAPLPVAEQLAARLINLPSSAALPHRIRRP